MKKVWLDEYIQLLGKRSDPNPFLVPNGSMRSAVNAWLVRQGMISKRRGYSRWSSNLTKNINKIFPYQNGFVVHAGDAASGARPYELKYVDKTGAVTAYTTAAAQLVPYTAKGSSGWRTRAAVAGQDFYFNSQLRTWRLSGATDTPRKAGGLTAPSFDNQSITTPLVGTSGFLADQFECAFRYLLGTTDNFGRDILGGVSGRITIINANGTGGWSAGVATNVTVRCLLPPEAQVNDWLNLYRSAQIAVGSTPDDDLQLTYQKYLTGADITKGYVDITDITPDELRGPYIYTSPNAEEGILQNNAPPPGCGDMVLHKNRLWFFNTYQPSSFDMQILSVGGSSGIQSGDAIDFVFFGGGFLQIEILDASFSPSVTSGQALQVVSGSVSYNIEQTALNIVSAINGASVNTSIWAQYVSGPNDTPGKINVYARDPGGVTFQVFVEPGSQRACYNPQLLSSSNQVDLVRVSNVITATSTFSNAMSFNVGEQMIVSGIAGSNPVTILSTPTSDSFTFADVGANASIPNQTAQLASAVGIGSIQQSPISLSTRTFVPNRMYFSKDGQFDAVPLVNYIDVGGAQADIIAAVSTNDQLWVFKRDGVIRITGTDETNWEPVDVDRTVVCNARETVVKFMGGPCGMTNKGYVMATTDGLTPLSPQIQKEFFAQMVGTPAGFLEPTAFAVAYDSESLLLLYFASGLDGITHAPGLQCGTGYIYSARANEWTDWSWQALGGPSAGAGKTCGAELNGQMYFGDRWASGSTFISQERKSRTAADFVDQFGDGNTWAIFTQIEPMLMTSRAPGWSKFFKEVQFFFEGTQPSSFTVDDANEWGSAGNTQTVVPSSGYASRLWPNALASHGRILMLTLVHNNISEGFDLAGIMATYALEGTEASR